MIEITSFKHGDSPVHNQWALQSTESAHYVSNTNGNGVSSIQGNSLGTTGICNPALQLSKSECSLNNVVAPRSNNVITHRESVTMTWQDVTLKTKEGKIILKDLCGKVRPGELTAIMGSSGAGKSTLLNVLSGFTKKKMSGKIFVNGAEREIDTFRKMSCYVTQDDNLLPHLTVRESITLAAALKVPKSKSKQERKEEVERVISSLSLADAENTRALNLSGGERKRLCIAQELISDPPLLFLDEPTSGLDSFSCFRCIELLKSLAQEGRTVVCTIHQPSAAMFELFDRLYLIAEGQCLYRGAPQGLISFFAEQGLVCPQYHNPADFAIEVSVGLHGEWNQKLKEAAVKLTDVDALTYVDKSITIGAKKVEVSFEANTLDLLQDNRKRGKGSRRDRGIFRESYKQENVRNYATSFWNQFKTLMYRCIISNLRNPMIFHLQLFSQLFMGLIIGALYYGIGNDAAKIPDNIGMILMTMLLCMMTGMMPTLLVFPTERAVVVREHLNSWYSTKAYYLAKSLVEIPFMVVFPIIFSLIVYYMTYQPNEALRVALFLIANILLALVGQSVSTIIGAFFDAQNAVFVASMVFMPLLMFSGFVLRTVTMPVYLRWISYISYTRYTGQAVMSAIYGMNRTELECSKIVCAFTDPEMYLEDYSVYDSEIYIYLGVPVLFYLVFRIAGYMAIKYKLSHSDN